MAGKTRAERLAVQIPAEMFAGFGEEEGAWHESADEIRCGLEWGADKARLLGWVRAQMALLLTERERACIQLHYLEGLTFREAGSRTGTNASSVHRAVTRAIRKLRVAAQGDPICRLWERHGGRIGHP